jgi:hypothetical protein
MALNTYDSLLLWGAPALAAIESGSMPPYAARTTESCQPLRPFLDDISLTNNEIATFRAWIEAQMPEGDAATAAEIPPAPVTDLANVSWTGTMPTPVTITQGPDRFYCMMIDPALTANAFFDGVQIMPGNDKIVHHVLVYSASDATIGDKAAGDGLWECDGGGIDGDRLIAAWAPGTPALSYPEGVATLLEAGTKIVLNVHYHPTGASTETDDATSVALRWHAGIPQYLAQTALIGNFETFDAATNTGLLADASEGGTPSFRIPAGAAAHVERQVFRVPADAVPTGEVSILGVASHMHYIGTNLRLRIVRAAPRTGEAAEECLLETPYWDFEWQRGYLYDAALADLPKVRPDDVLEIDCTYNNSLSNPNVARLLAEQGLSQPIDIPLGEGTLSEMCLGAYFVAAKLGRSDEQSVLESARALAKMAGTMQ